MGPPNTSTHDVDKLQINIDGKDWENVAVRSGSRTVNAGHSETHSIKVRAVNSRGDVGSTASACHQRKQAQAQAEAVDFLAAHGWRKRYNVGNRFCMEYRNSLGDNYGGPGDCKGDHWSYPGNSITATCYIVSGSNRWYHQESGTRSINNGLLIRGDHVREAGGSRHLNGGAPSGMGTC